MARKTNKSDLAPVLAAAKHWIDRCLISGALHARGADMGHKRRRVGILGP